MKIPGKLRQFMRHPKTHNKIKGGRGGGKTKNIPAIIIRIMSQAPLWVICGREIQKSLKESSFSAMVKEIHNQGLAHIFNINKTEGLITAKTGAKAVFVGLQNHTVDSIKSYDGFHWAWIEEAQSVTKRSLDVLIPTLRTDGHFLARFGEETCVFPLRMFIYTYNPYSWDDPIEHVLPDSRDDVQTIEINWPDNPWFPKSLNEERLEAKKYMSPEEYNRIWEGIPFEDAERAVMLRAEIQGAMERSVSRDGGIVVGADIARFGSDRTVFIKREGLQQTDKFVMHQKDTQEVARRLFDFAESGRIVVDDTGVGGGVTDKLRDMGAHVTAINFGSKARNKKKYPDVISEMWFNLANMMPTIGLIEDRELLSELSSRHFKYTPDERRKVESKEEYKKRTGRKSPDLADAAILCYYGEREASIPDIQVGGMF